MSMRTTELLTAQLLDAKPTTYRGKPARVVALFVQVVRLATE